MADAHDYHDAALLCITFICDVCKACLDSEDLPPGQPRFPEGEWFVVLGDEAQRRGWYVQSTEHSLKTICPDCAEIAAK